MGSQWVEDPSWGNIFSGIVKGMNAAPGEALSNIAQAEQIKDARIKRQRELESYQQGIATGNAYEKALPPAYAAPTQQTVLGPYVGEPNAAPADQPELPTVDLSYTDPRAQAQAEARRNLAIATYKQAAAAGKTSEMMPGLGYGTVAAAGVPATADERAATQFMTTGKFPTADESKANNMAVVDKVTGQPTGRIVYSHNGRTDLLGNPIVLQPNETLAGASTVKAEAPNPLESAAVARRGLLDMEFKRKTQGGVLTPEQAQLTQRLFDVANPLSAVTSQEGGRPVDRQVRAEPIPPSLMDLYNHVQQRTGAQPPPPPPPAVVSNDPNAPTLPPIVPPQPADPNAPRVMRQGAANPAELRKEYNNTQQVSDWNTTVPLFNSAIKSAQNPNNQEDINIIYAFAKLMDPGSVVRESEQRLVSTSGTIPESILGQFHKLVTGGGSMDPQVRLQIIDTLANRLEEYRHGKEMVEKWYREKVAPSVGLDPDLVIPPTMEPRPYNRDEIVRLTNQQRQQQQQPQTSTNPRVDEILNR